MQQNKYDITYKSGSDYTARVDIANMDLSQAIISGSIIKTNISKTKLADFTTEYISGGSFYIRLDETITSTLIADTESIKPEVDVHLIGKYDIKVVPVSGNTFYPLSGKVYKETSAI